MAREPIGRIKSNSNKPGSGRRATNQIKINRIRSVDPNAPGPKDLGGYYGEAYGNINSKQIKKVQNLESKKTNMTSRGQNPRVKNTNWDGTPTRKTNLNRVSTKASKTTRTNTSPKNLKSVNTKSPTKLSVPNKIKAQGSKSMSAPTMGYTRRGKK